jgi:hypothetical protein
MAQITVKSFIKWFRADHLKEYNERQMKSTQGQIKEPYKAHRMDEAISKKKM